MDLHDLQRMRNDQLDALFGDTTPGDLPNGTMDGTVLLGATTPFAYTIGSLIRRYVWRGKTFDATRGFLFNRFPTVHAISAVMSIGPSFYDKQPCIVLDYTDSVASHVRDELRQVGPGLYLGIAYQRDKPILHFALQTQTNDGRTT